MPDMKTSNRQNIDMDDGLHRTANAKAQADARQQQPHHQAGSNKHVAGKSHAPHQKKWSHTPWKLWLARAVLAVFAIVVVTAAVRGIRSGIDRFTHEDTLFERAVALLPFGSSSSSTTTTTSSNIFGSWFHRRSGAVPAYSRKVRAGYDSLKESLASMEEELKTNADKAGSKAYAKLKDNFDKLSDLMEQYMPDADRLTDTDKIQSVAEASYRRLQDASHTFGKNLEKMKDSIDDKNKELYAKLVTGAKSFSEAVKSNSHKLASMASDKIEASKDALEETYDSLSEHVEDLTEDLEKRAKEMKRKGKKALSKVDHARIAALESFSESFEELRDAMSKRSTLQKMYQETKHVVKDGMSSASDAFDNALDQLKKSSSRIARSLTGRKAESTFNKAYRNLEKQLHSARKSIGNKAKDVAEDASAATAVLNEKVQASLQSAYNEVMHAIGKNPTFQEEITDAYHSMLRTLGFHEETRLERLKRRLSSWF